MTHDPDTHNEITSLIVGHFDGSLTEAQETQLAEALGTSSEAQQRFLAFMRMEGRLHSLGRDGFLREPAKPRPAEREHPTPPLEDEVSVLQHSQPRSRQRSRLLAATTSLAACVAVLLMLTSGVLWPSTVSASSVLQNAQQAASAMVDRTYRLVVTHPHDHDAPPLRELTITVRGGGRFVLQAEREAYTMGNDGVDYWLARRNGPVFVTADFRKLAPELRRQIPNRRLLDAVLASPDEPLLLNISDLLQLIERKYDMELVPSPKAEEHRVRATRRPGFRGGPTMIEFQTDATSGIVRKATMHHEGSQQTTLELVDTPNRSNHWYHHSAHAPGRRVERLIAKER